MQLFYWKAYSLNKLGKTPLAIATCDQLHSQFARQPMEQGLRCHFDGRQVDPKAMAMTRSR